MTDSTDTTGSEQPEVEGHGYKVRWEPAAEVEGHKFKLRHNNAEAPQETDAEADEAREGDEPEVEGHKFRLV